MDMPTKLKTVEAKIRSIAEALPGADYMFCDWARANYEIDKIERPTVVYVLPPSGNMYFGWAEVKDCPEAQLAFLCSTEFDFEGEENDALVERMKRLAIRFVRLLNASGMFALIEGNVPYQVLYDHLDQNVTGVVLTLKLIEEEGVAICEDEERKEDEA